MPAFFLSILGAVAPFLKNALTFVKAKALVLWGFISVVLPKIFSTWKSFRLLRLACAGAVFYMVYRLIRDVILLAVSGIDVAVNISSLISSTSWASWLVWDGPFQGSVLWDQLLSCVSMRVSLQVLAYTLTKIGWFKSSLLSGGLGPRS